MYDIASWRQSSATWLRLVTLIYIETALVALGLAPAAAAAAARAPPPNLKVSKVWSKSGSFAVRPIF